MLRFYNKKQDNGLLKFIFGISLIVFIGAAINIGDYMIKSAINKGRQDVVADLIDGLDGKADSEKLVDRYASIRDKYPDIVGRVIISNYSGVNDLIVMHTPDKPDYYLYKDVNREKSKSGTTYLDYRCSLEKLSDNFILYAHNMRNRTQFGCLRYYKEKSYWEKYPTVIFETMYDEPVKYEIFAAFYSRRFYKYEQNVFRYYDFYDASNEAEFDDFVKKVKDSALYETGITPKYGEQLLTLSTCDYTYHKEGRFVVVARKKTGRVPGGLFDSEEDDSIDIGDIGDIDITPEPTRAPTPTPTRRPTLAPTRKPTLEPTVEPTIDIPESTDSMDFPETTMDLEPTVPSDLDDFDNTSTPRN